MEAAHPQTDYAPAPPLPPSNSSLAEDFHDDLESNRFTQFSDAVAQRLIPSIAVYQDDFQWDSTPVGRWETLAKSLPPIVTCGSIIVERGKPHFKGPPLVDCPRCQTKLTRGTATLTFRHAPAATRQQQVESWVCSCGEFYVSGEIAREAHLLAFACAPPSEGVREVAQLTSLRLAGWKSIRDAKIELRPLNILIGANGAGKSNLVSFFNLMYMMMADRLQVHLRVNGGADSLLHFGSKRTPAIEADFRFTTNPGQCGYSFRLVPEASNALIFDEEKLALYWKALPAAEHFKSKSAHPESALDALFDLKNPTTDFDRSGEFIHRYLHSCRVYHFHDTTRFGPMRRDCLVDANRFLSLDAANLPAMLYLYRERFPTAYRRIVAAVKAVAPFFEDFVLEPLRLNPKNIALHWRSKDSEYEFGAHQLSDGTLRAVALFTLLLQPEDDLPELIVLDEPELGLHPAALAVLADLVKSASRHSQLLIATQSTALIDHFEVDDIVTVNLRDGCSTFERLDPKGLKDWLAEYTLSELWERNVIGGGPY